MPMPTVSFQAPTDYGAEAQAIERQRRYAELLRQQGMDPLGPTESVGGWAIRKSPMEGIGKFAQQLSGAYAANKADERQKELAQKYQTEGAAALARGLRAYQGTPASTEIMPMDEQANGGMGQANAPINLPAVKRSPEAAMAAFGSHPATQPYAQMIAAQMMKPPEWQLGERNNVESGLPEKFMFNKLNPTQQIPVGGQAYKPPMAAGPDSTLIPAGRQPMMQPPPVGAPGMPGSSPQGPQPVPGIPGAMRLPAKEEKNEAQKLADILTNAGIDPQGPQGKRLFAALATKIATHQPAANMKVTLPGQEKAFEQELGKEQAKTLVEGRKNADDAAQIINTVNIGRNIMKSGMVTGFGANAIVSIGQALKQAGIDFGGDATANAQAYSANMAQNVGKIIKQFGSGTGLSDADREYAIRMAGGQITLDKAAITKILDINEKAARNIIKIHNRRAEGVKSNIPLKVDEPQDEVERSTSKSGKPMHKENGQWVYD